MTKSMKTGHLNMISLSVSFLNITNPPIIVVKPSSIPFIRKSSCSGKVKMTLHDVKLQQNLELTLPLTASAKVRLQTRYGQSTRIECRIIAYGKYLIMLNIFYTDSGLRPGINGPNGRGSTASTLVTSS